MKAVGLEVVGRVCLLGNNGRHRLRDATSHMGRRGWPQPLRQGPLRRMVFYELGLASGRAPAVLRDWSSLMDRGRHGVRLWEMGTLAGWSEGLAWDGRQRPRWVGMSWIGRDRPEPGLKLELELLSF